MTITSTLWHNKDKLVQLFHLATIHGILHTWRLCGSQGNKPQEPDFVAGLVIESTPLILAALNSVLSSSRVSVSMSAVFCHQSPLVTFGTPTSVSCELGDILFAYVHTSKDGRVRRNALLFQAKKTSQQPYRIQKGESDQLHLYTNWPDFVYTRSSFLNGQKRLVTPKTLHAGAQYLLIDDRPKNDPMSGLSALPGTYPVGCCMPDVFLISHTDLASELFNLFLFRTGRPFDDRKTAATMSGWSQVVWDVLETGVKKKFNRENSDREDASRGMGDTIQMLDGASFARATSRQSYSTVADIIGLDGAHAFFSQGNDYPPNNRDRLSDNDEPQGGVSVVLIETYERESEGWADAGIYLLL